MVQTSVFQRQTGTPWERLTVERCEARGDHLPTPAERATFPPYRCPAPPSTGFVVQRNKKVV